MTAENYITHKDTHLLLLFQKYLPNEKTIRHILFCHSNATRVPYMTKVKYKKVTTFTTFMCVFICNPSRIHQDCHTILCRYLLK